MHKQPAVLFRLAHILHDMMSCLMLAKLMAVVLLSVAPATMLQAQDWEIASRNLPPPAGASSELNTSIAATPRPNIAWRQNYPKSAEEWNAVIARRAATRNTPLVEVEEQFGVTITTDEIAGVGVFRIQPGNVQPDQEKRLFLYAHGGAYVYGGGIASVGEAAIIASRAGIPTISIDYRMPPADPFPAAVDDLVSVYQEVIKTHQPAAIAIGGTSAGGGLALAGVHRFKALELPVPGAIYAGTPWADLTKTGDTLFTNEGIDRILVTYDGSLGAAALLYANGHDMKDPLLSPVYGDFNDFPATFLVTGTRDMFLSDTVRTHRKLRAAGTTADLHVYEGMSHAGYAFELASPESKDMYAELSRFLKQHLH
jgi:monoterpene epsilon-lactone hydrolase